MKRIYDFYRYPPKAGQTIAMLPVSDDGQGNIDWAWFKFEEGETLPPDADMAHPYDPESHRLRPIRN